MFDMNFYPDLLIPQKEYKYKTDTIIDELRSMQDFHVSRRVDGSFDDLTYIQGGQYRLKDDALACFDERLSMNILGAGFQIENTCFRVMKPASDKWNGDTVDKFQYADNIELKDPSFAVVYLASLVHNKRVPYDRSFDKQGKADDLQKKLQEIQDLAHQRLDNKCLRLCAVISLFHSPTNANYWHIEMRLKPSEVEADIKDTKAVWKQTMLSTVCEEVFRIFLKIEEAEVIVVDKTIFMK